MANPEYSLNAFQFLILIAIATAIGFIFKYYYDKIKIFRLGSKLPGPKAWPFIGNAWHFLGSELDVIAKLEKFRSYKKLYAVWLGHELNVFIHSPDFAEILCKSSKLSHRSDKTKFLKFIAPKGLLFMNGAAWRKPRQLVESALPYSLIKNSIPLFQLQAEILAKRIQCEVGKPLFSILHYLQACIFDIVCDISVEFELKAQKSEVPIFNDFHIATRLVRERFYNVLYQWDFLYRLFPDGKQFFSVIDSLVQFVTDAVVIRKEKYEEEKWKSEENLQKAKKRVFWQILLEDETLSIPEIKDHVISLIVTGYETTASAISLALILLALHPDKQEKVYEEISSVIDGDFNDEKIHQLEYLDRVIKETLRLFPIVPICFRKATGDIQMGEYLIPEGADVNLDIYQLHRDPEQYDDPHNFNPDHFLPENIAKRHPYSYIPFLSGMRNCIGGKLATMVMKIIVAKLLLCYKFESDYKTIEDVPFRGDISIEVKDGALVRILERQ